LKKVVAVVMIYGEDSTQWSETAQVEVKIMSDCDNLRERKDLRKVVCRKKR